MEGQVLTQTPAEPARSHRRGPVGGRWRLPGWHWLAYKQFWLAALASAVLAGISAAALPTVASYDPWAWISWGREVFSPTLSFAISGGPSWKPLPVMFTAIYSLAGSTVAPTLWVITARAGGFLGMIAAYLLAARLVARDGRAPRWAPVLAGLIAAAGILITQDYWDEWFRGTSEPTEIATALWAVLAFLDGRRGWAFVFGVATSQLRPEAWPLVVVYAIWLWWKEPRLRVLVVLGLFSIPFFWFAPPWVGSGQPFLAAIHAEEYNGGLGPHPFWGVLGRGVDIQLLPVLLAGGVAVVFAWFDKPRDWLTLSLAGATVVWWVVVVGMTLDGYPGLERFYLPAAGLTCVLAGVGIVRLGLLGARLLPAVRGGASTAVAVGLSAVLVAILLPFTWSRITDAGAEEKIASQAVSHLDQMTEAVKAVGGHDGVYPCKISFAAVNHSVQTALAYKLHVTLGRVGTAMVHQGVMFVGPHDSIDGIAPAIAPSLTQRKLIAQVGIWKMYRVTAPNSNYSCVGK
ncbi:MAG TPA: hypothetical protein VMF57_01785 [Solirubrobacteraceae bacterium]|nr:hypothetical protein [Solirubrobacteraceae bacterium]